jgi:phage terminase small subunit
MSEKPLNEKQKAFADYYIETLNAYESAIKAGYSENYAKAQSYKLLEHVGIKAYIQERLASKEKERIASQDEVLEFLTSVMRGEVMDQMGFETPVKERRAAAVDLGKRYGLFTENMNINTKVVVFEGENELED